MVEALFGAHSRTYLRGSLPEVSSNLEEARMRLKAYQSRGACMIPSLRRRKSSPPRVYRITLVMTFAWMMCSIKCEKRGLCW
jgi:hypothetical protein